MAKIQQRRSLSFNARLFARIKLAAKECDMSITAFASEVLEKRCDSIGIPKDVPYEIRTSSKRTEKEIAEQASHHFTF